MKIVFIITDYGSFNNFLAELAVNLVKNNNEVFLLCSKDKVINHSDKYDYYSLGIDIEFVDFPRNFNLIKHFITSLKIRSVLDRINPDLVHVHFTTGIFTTVFAGKLRFKTIGTFHGLGYPVLKGLKRMVFKLVEEICFSRLDQIWLLNKFDYELVIKKYPLKSFLYNSKGLGCDLEKFNNEYFDSNYKKKLQRYLGVKSNDFVISYVGRFVQFKGFHLVIKSFFELKRRNLNVKLILMGGYDKIHPTGLTTTEELMLENSKNIINIGFTHEIEKYLSVSDLFIFPSVKEGMPVCILEALAMGLPVITTNSRGCNDLIIDNYNGNLIEDVTSEGELVRAVIHLIHDHNKLIKFSKNALKDRRLYDRNIFIHEQIKIYYDSLLNLKP